MIFSREINTELEFQVRIRIFKLEFHGKNIHKSIHERPLSINYKL